MQAYCNVFFLRNILKRTSTEAHVYMRRHQGAKVKHFDVSNVIYHKFSYGAVSYTLNEENVNIMLGFTVKPKCFILRSITDMTLDVPSFIFLRYANLVNGYERRYDLAILDIPALLTPLAPCTDFSWHNGVKRVVL